MCARAGAAHKVHSDFETQKDAMHKTKKELKEAVKGPKKTAKAAWKDLVQVTNDELSGAAGKRRNQAKDVVPDTDLVEGDGTTGKVQPDTDTCGGEDADLCQAFMDMYSVYLMEADAKKALNDAKFAEKEYKARCHNKMENAAFPDAKSPSKATWGGLWGDFKKCKAEYKATIKTEESDTKDAYNAAKKDCKKASKNFHKLAKKTCGDSDKKDKRDKKDKKKRSKKQKHRVRQLSVGPF
jgi:hypothetical protein